MSSLPKKNSRVVVFQDKSYRWTIRKSDDKLFLFVQEDCDEPGNLLNIEMNDQTNGDGYGIGNSDVVKEIAKALALGWEPSKKGPPVRLRSFGAVKEGE